MRAIKFQEEIAPKVKEWLGNESGCIVSVSGSGTIFGLKFKEYLHKKGRGVNYVEMSRNKVRLFKRDVEGRKLIVVDSAVYTGDTQRRIRKQINALRNRLKIKEVKYAVGLDMIGLADWSCDPNTGVLYY